MCVKKSFLKSDITLELMSSCMLESASESLTKWIDKNEEPQLPKLFI